MAAHFNGLTLFDILVYIIHHRSFKCSLHHAKQSFFRAFNFIYGRVGNTASEEVTLSLIKLKCVPCLLHGLDACPINSTIANSLDFTVRRILFKIFKTSTLSIIRDCQVFFDFPDVIVSIQQRRSIFLKRYSNSENFVCQSFNRIARSELSSFIVTSK